jgi:20S proteasome alpha/beta subunit
VTLTVALRGRDGLVIAADSRGTIGDPRGLTAVNDSHIKILKLSRYCGIAIAGASELAAKIVDELKVILDRKKLEFADEILEETRTLVRMCYDDWFAKFALQDRPSLAFTLVGYQLVMDNYIPRTYSIVSKADFARFCSSAITQWEYVTRCTTICVVLNA